MIKLGRQLTNVGTSNKLEHLWKTDLLCWVFLWNVFTFRLNEKHSSDCHLTITDLELHFNYYFDNNLVFKQFLELNTAWYVQGTATAGISRNERFSAGWYWVWSPGEMWPVIYIIVWYLQCRLITGQIISAGEQLKILSRKTVAPGRVLSAPGDLSTTRRVVGGAVSHSTGQSASQQVS